MKNNEAKLTISRDFFLGETDSRLFGSFLEHMGSTIYGGIYQPGHSSADSNGFRTDVLSLLRELNLSVIRYPGGNFVSGYNWEDGVGPREKRPTRIEPAWKALEPNKFGLNEYMQWLKELGSDPLYTVNLGTRGVDDARNLLEYCNRREGSKYSELRIAHGAEEPYGIKAWCLGNEMDGPWQMAAKTAEEYGRLAMETGKIMKWIDPEIELVASGSSLPRMSTYPEWDRLVLMESYEIVDYISLHHYVDRTTPTDEISSRSFFEKTEHPVFLKTKEYLARTLNVDQQIHDIISTCDYVKAVKRSSKTLNLCFDEWNVISTNKDLKENYVPWVTGSPIDFTPHTMEDLLAFASTMMAILRRADRVKIACQSLLVNTGGMVFAPQNGPAFRNSIYYPFMHISQYGRGTVLINQLDCPVYQTKEFENVPCIDSAAVFNQEADTLTIFAVNRMESEFKMMTDTRDFGNSSIIEHIEISHVDLNAVNSSDNPFIIKPVQSSDSIIVDQIIESILKPYSWNVIRIKFTTK